MRSIQRRDNAPWREPILGLFEGGTDIDNDAAVRKAFDDGLAWAKAEGFPDRRPMKEHPADQYLRTRGARFGPIIPKFMRAYCVHMLGTRCYDFVSTMRAVKQANRERRLSLEARSRASTSPRRDPLPINVAVAR